jgi:hypothetical protein
VRTVTTIGGFSLPQHLDDLHRCHLRFDESIARDEYTPPFNAGSH